MIPDALREEVLADLYDGTMGCIWVQTRPWGGCGRGFIGGVTILTFENGVEFARAVYASRNSPTPSRRTPLQPIATSYPIQLVATDILGALPESVAGSSYILVVVDYFTRYAEAYPIPNQEATTVVRQLVDEFFWFSPPEQLHSDQGRNFESAVITEACRLLGVDKSRKTPYHPQSDGLVERFNRTLLSMLATAVTDRPFEWEQHLRHLCFAYNTSVHPTTGYCKSALSLLLVLT